MCFRIHHRGGQLQPRHAQAYPRAQVFHLARVQAGGKAVSIAAWCAHRVLMDGARVARN
jgi:hypothetical protein